MTDRGCFKLPLENNNSNDEIPGRTGPEAEAHVALGRQRIIAQLLEVLWPQVLVSVPRQCVLACGGTKQAPIRSSPLGKVSAVENPIPLVTSKSPMLSVFFSCPRDNICGCHLVGKSMGRG